MTLARVLARRILIEGLALKRTFSFHEANSDIKKFLIVVSALTWGVITIGIAFEQAEVTPTYTMLTAVLWAFVGRLWGENAKIIEGGSE